MVVNIHISYNNLPVKYTKMYIALVVGSVYHVLYLSCSTQTDGEKTWRNSLQKNAMVILTRKKGFFNTTFIIKSYYTIYT